MKKSSYVFGAALAAVGIGSVIQNAEAATAAAFTFETSGVALNSVNVSSSVIGPLVAESGVGSALGSHASSQTVYSSPTGNGSPRSLSSNYWTSGDYYQFNVPTTSLSKVVVSFDQASSSTGPGHFILSYSTDGVNFSTYTGYTLPYITYTVTSSATSNTAGSVSASSAFASGASSTSFAQSFDLSAITGLVGNATAEFRLVDADAVSLSGGTVANTGSDRVDNFVVSDTAATPEPTTFGALAVAGVAAMLRRRTA